MCGDMEVTVKITVRFKQCVLQQRDVTAVEKGVKQYDNETALDQ